MQITLLPLQLSWQQMLIPLGDKDKVWKRCGSWMNKQLIQWTLAVLMVFTQSTLQQMEDMFLPSVLTCCTLPIIERHSDNHFYFLFWVRGFLFFWFRVLSAMNILNASTAVTEVNPPSIWPTVVNSCWVPSPQVQTTVVSIYMVHSHN